MRKIIIVLLALGLYLNWNRIDRFFDGSPAVSAANGEVILYATSWCGYCRKTRELFEEHGVAYKEYDIETSEEGLRQYEALNGNGVPVMSVHGTVIHGYDEDAILAALED